MAKLKNDIDDKIDSIVAKLDFDGMQVWLQKDKLPESLVKSEFGGKIPDELKDKVVSDEEFSRLREEVSKIGENNNTNANNINENNAEKEDNVKEDSKDDKIIDEMPKISQETNEVSTPIKKYAKQVSRETNISDSLLSQFISKIANEDEITKIAKLADLGKRIPPNSNVSQTIYDAALGKQIMQNIAKEKDTLSTKEMLDRLMMIKFIEALNPSSQTPPPQPQINIEDILKLVITLTQLQKPQNNGQEILSIVDKISTQQAQLTERIFNQMKEMNEKTISLINQLVQKTDSGYSKDELKKLAESLAQAKENKLDAKAIAEEIEKQSKNAIELLKALGYKVDKGENAIESIDKIFNSKLGDTLLNLISNPEKIGQITNAIRKTPAKNMISDISTMPNI